MMFSYLLTRCGVIIVTVHVNAGIQEVLDHSDGDLTKQTNTYTSYLVCLREVNLWGFPNCADLFSEVL